MGKAHLALLYKTACRVDCKALSLAIRLHEAEASKLFGDGWLTAFRYARLLLPEEQQFCSRIRQAVRFARLRVKRVQTHNGLIRNVWDAPLSDLDYEDQQPDTPTLFSFLRQLNPEQL